MGRSLMIFSDAPFKMPAWQSYWSLLWVNYKISISNIMCMFFVTKWKSVLIFSKVTLKMTVWRPRWFYFCCLQTQTLVLFEYQLQSILAHYFCVCVEAYWFSAILISKWRRNSHNGIFGFPWTLYLAWLSISSPNLSSVLLLSTSGSIFVLSDVRFNMAT